MCKGSVVVTSSMAVSSSYVGDEQGATGGASFMSRLKDETRGGVGAEIGHF